MKKYKVVALPKRFEGGDGGGTYTVKSGDTFDEIAYAIGTTPDKLGAANPKVIRDKIYPGQVLIIPEAAKVEEKTTKEKEVEKDIVIDLEGLKKGIAHVESTDGVNMINPTSSATGLYGQLYNEVKDLLPELKGVTREQFSKDLDLQNKVFEKRFYDGWDGLPSLQSNAIDLYEEYSPQIKDFNYSYEDIAALSNFLGRQGTRKFFASIRDSKEFEPPGVNKTPAEYLESARPYYTAKEEQDGGFIEIDLSDEEAQMYADGGYVVEELPSYEPGGPNPNPLQEWNKIQKQRWSGVKEWDPAGKSTLREYNKRMGVNYNPNDHWSAITISNAVMANSGANNRDEIRALGFNPTKSHSGYISDAFKTNKNPEYKYNKYIAERPTTDLNYNIGDILVRGRKDGKKVGTSKWTYEDFATHGSGYPSHGDIIVDKGIDDKGAYVIIAGGNLSDTYKNKKVYAKDIGSEYKVKLTDRDALKMGSSQKSSNLGEDVTINEKKNSIFPDNFDGTFDNDQYVDEKVSMLPAINNFQSMIETDYTQQDPISPDSLGIGYVPYQYQFDVLSSLPVENEEPELKYIRLSSGTDEESTEDTDDIVIDPNASTVDEKEDEVAFEPKVYEGDKVYRKDYSDEDKQTVQEIENELKNLNSQMMAEINQISASEMSAATTEEEKGEAAKKRLQMIMNMTGSTTAGANKAEVDAITKKYKERKKQLEAQLEKMQLTADMNLVNEGKLAKEKFVETHAPGFQKAAAEFEKNSKKGLIWNSFVEPLNEEQAQYGIHDKTLFNGQTVWKNYENRASIKDPYQQEWLGSQDFGRMYGDGSIKYGQWVTKEELEKKRSDIAQAEYMRQQQDPLGTGQSGRTTGIWPSFFEDALYGASWLMAPSFMAAEAIIPDEFEQGALENIYDAYATMFKKRKPGEKGYEEYQAAVERSKERDKNYRQYGEFMKTIAGTNSASNPPSVMYNRDGGYIVDLDEDEAAQYAQKGYIVEEIK